VISLLSTPSQRIGFAIAFSLLLHGWLMLGPSITLPQFKSKLPPLVAKLQAIPTVPAKPRTKTKRPAKPAPVPAPVAAPIPEPVVKDIAPAEPVAEIPLAASAPVATEIAASQVAPAETLAQAAAAQPTVAKPVERPLLPHRAQLTFAVNKGTGNFKIGETVQTMEIEDGHYVLQSVTKTVGVAKLFKSYKLTQFSSGSYTPENGLQPERFFEEREEQTGTQRYTMEFDHVAQLAHFSQGGEIALPADTQDILSILYQFPPVHGVEKVAIYVSNGKKIESYQFEVAYEAATTTPLGPLHTVHLSKIHTGNEEGLEIWLAQEYRLFPVKMRIIERNGVVSGEIIITDIRVEDTQQETKKNVAN
jgi:hypothetical protein